jgi:hypothetical protein
MSGHRFGIAAALAVVMSLTIFSAKAEKMVITDKVQIKDSEVKKKALHKNMKPRARELHGKGALSVPGTGKRLDQGTMRNQDAARAARDLQQLQKMHEAQRAMQPGNRPTGMRDQLGVDGRDGNSLRERAAGSSDRPGAGSVTFGDGKSGSRPPAGPVNHDTGPRDYRTGTQNSATKRRPGGFINQPSSPASGANIRGADHVSDRTKRVDTTGTDGTKITKIDIERDDGSSSSYRTTTDPETNEVIHETVVHTQPDGSSIEKGSELLPDGTREAWSRGRDASGRDDIKNPPTSSVVSRPRNSTSQPDEHGSGTSNDNCDWNPVWGRCMKQRTSHKDMTAQPSSGDEGTVSTGGSARPRLGAEAVTNPGDGSWAAERSGYTGGGPIDMRDPPKGLPGTGPVPR